MLRLPTAIRYGIAAATLLAAVSAGRLQAQEAEDTPVRTHIKVTDADIKAAANVKYSAYHVMAANVPGAKEKAAALNAESARRLAEARGGEFETETALPKGTLTSPFFYPADLTKAKGTTLAAAVIHAVYIDYKGTIAA